MTTEIVFEDGERMTIPNGDSANASHDRRLGELAVDDYDSYRYAVIKRGVYPFSAVKKGEPVSKRDLLDIIPSLRTEVARIEYLGKLPVDA